jgi:HSF-type DNA-binding
MINRQEMENFTLPTRGIIRQEDTTEQLAKKLCLLPLKTINELRSIFLQQLLQHHQNPDERLLLERHRTRHMINLDMFRHFRTLNNQFDPETGSIARTLNFNFHPDLALRSDQDTCIIAQHPFLNRNVERKIHEIQDNQVQIAIHSMKTATKDEIMGKFIVANDGAQCKKGKRNPIHTFPYKLHKMLSDPEFSECISWLPHGRAWKIIRRTQFENDVLPHHFRHGRYSSFMRQVSKLQGLSQLKTKKTN